MEDLLNDYIAKKNKAKELKEHKEVKKGVVKPPTQEEVDYSYIVKTNPVVEDLVERLGLVSLKTGVKLRKVSINEKINPKLTASKRSKKVTIKEIALRIMQERNNYKESTIIKRIKELTGVSKERAKKGFELMKEKRVIKYAHLDLYYLADSTPF